MISWRSALVAQKIFRWVAIAKRPLTLDVLREAISIEIRQPYSKPERLIYGINQLISWCESLVHIDKELETMHFAHQTVYKFSIEGSWAPPLTDFHVDRPDADHHAGEICVTYLNFNDFKTTLSQRPQPVKLVAPAAIAKMALSPRSKTLKTLPFFNFSPSPYKNQADMTWR
jgi:hypothetical protein